jgi:hypothetical protein
VESQSHESHEPPEPRCFFQLTIHAGNNPSPERAKDVKRPEMVTKYIPLTFPLISHADFGAILTQLNVFISFSQNRRKLV